MRITATAALVVHGLIHVMGFMLLWRIAQLGQLRYADMHPTPGTAAGIAVGSVWLVAAVLFTITAVLLIIRKAVWRPAALVAVVASVPVLAMSASTAAAGLVIDAAVVLAVAASWHWRRP